MTTHKGSRFDRFIPWVWMLIAAVALVLGADPVFVMGSILMAKLALMDRR